LRHGEAVAIGLALDTRYSVQIGMLAAGSEVRVCTLLEKLGFRLWHPALEQTGADGQLVVLGGLRDFREHLGGELTITLLRELGSGVEVHEMDTAQIRQAIAWLKYRLERR
jgi:3-dehydroquinate synthase